MLRIADIILETEACFVALGDTSASRIENVKVGKHLHTMVVAVAGVPSPLALVNKGPKVDPANILDAGRETKQSASLIDPLCGNKNNNTN